MFVARAHAGPPHTIDPKSTPTELIHLIHAWERPFLVGATAGLLIGQQVERLAEHTTVAPYGAAHWIFETNMNATSQSQLHETHSDDSHKVAICDRLVILVPSKIVLRALCIRRVREDKGTAQWRHP